MALQFTTVPLANARVGQSPRAVNAGGAQQIYRSNPFVDQSGNHPKMRSNDRVIRVKPIPGVKARSTSGVLDNRVYSGEAKLHARLDSTGLWGLVMEGGTIPPILHGIKWTRWDDCLKDVTNYFKTRNLEVVEVID